MTFQETIVRMSDEIMLVPLVFLLFGGIILTFKTRFVQFRAFSRMIKLLFAPEADAKDAHTVKARKALFTAMSTTIGMGNIVAPIFAMGFGGPGALVGFMLATIFGGAATYAEVVFSLNFRKRYADGTIAGGPMQYLKQVLHPMFSYLYAGLGVFLLASWTASQSNQLAVLLVPWNIERNWTAIIVAVLIVFMLIGGIKRVGAAAEKMVPSMFLLYTFAMLWIIVQNIAKLPDVISLIFSSFVTAHGAKGMVIGVGMQRALRWGLAKGYFANESGVGTASIAHAAAETDNAVDQGVLAIVSVYTNGILCLLSGIVVLITGVWQDPTLSYDISMMNQALSMYFPGIGTLILMVSGVLFSFSTIMGNSYYGTQCFLFATNNRWIYLHHALVAAFIICGAVLDVKLVWSAVDFFLIPVAIPHIIGIVILSFKKSHLLRA